MSAGSVVLVGPPGAGVSTVAREIAAMRVLAFVDTERRAAAALGYADVARAFVVAGEEGFREAEVREALAVLASRTPQVVALGSAAPLSDKVRDAVVGTPVVQLTVSLAHAAPRLGLALARPVFLGNPRAQWAKLAAERRALYDEIATTTIDTDDATPHEVAERVIAEVWPKES